MKSSTQYIIASSILICGCIAFSFLLFPSIFGFLRFNEPRIILHTYQKDWKTTVIEWESKNAPLGAQVFLEAETFPDSEQEGVSHSSFMNIGNGFPTQGSYEWVQERERDNGYRIHAFLQQSPNFPSGSLIKNKVFATDSSKGFEIKLPPNEERWVKVIYPKGGEKLEAGQPLTVLWESKGISSDKNINISFSRYDSVWLSTTTKNTGTIAIDLPETIWETCEYFGHWNEPLPSGTKITRENNILSISAVQEDGFTFFEGDSSDTDFSFTGPCKD